MAGNTYIIESSDISTSGTIYKYSFVRLVLKETVDNNRNSSTISWSLEGYVTETSSAYSYGYSSKSLIVPMYVDINGVRITVRDDKTAASFRMNYNGVSGTSKNPIIYGQGTTGPIIHNSDGSKTISVGFSVAPAKVVRYRASSTMELTNTSKPSDFTLSADIVNTGDILTFLINKALPNYKHKLYWKGGNVTEYQKIAENIDENYSWLVPDEVANAFPTTNSGTLYFKVKSYDGTVEYGEKEKTAKFEISDDSMPSIVYASPMDNGQIDIPNGYLTNHNGERVYVWDSSEDVGSTPDYYEFSVNKLTNPSTIDLTVNSMIKTTSGYLYVIESINDITVRAKRGSTYSPRMLYNKFIKGVSILGIVVKATPSNGASIKYYDYTIGSKQYNGKTTLWFYESDVCTETGSIPYSVTVTDTRGKTATYNGVFDVIAYSEPILTTFDTKRTDSDLNDDDNGDYVSVKVVGSGTIIESSIYSNYMKWALRYRELGSQEWIETIDLGSTAGINATLNNLPMSSNASWEVEIVAIDSISGIRYFEAPPISSAQVPMDLLYNGKGMGIGTIATKSDTLQVGWNVEAMKDISAGSPIITDPRSVSAKNANGDIQIKVDIDGTIGLYDNKNSKWILKSTETGYELSPDFTTDSTEITKFHNYTDGPGYVYVGSDGVAEVGEYLDFHIKSLNSSSTDHDIRMQAKYSSTNGKYLAVDTQIEATNLRLSSDRRLKSDITAISDDEALKILDFIPSTYRFNGQNRYSKGLIAQEVEEILPELVHTDDNGYKSLDYISIIPLLIKMVQIQQKEIDELKEKVK